ncbi:MAG TPA: PQQ-binding-like beta-propeller repeat protein, partial [Longimicrobiales bacterium]|nr:PQQ-binding-like beta-propeller repeat protein [Longimicrobiales bacterium]
MSRQLHRSTLFVALAASLAAPAAGQDRGNPHGEWRYWGGDAWSTRYSPLDQIDGNNFSRLQVAWVWRGDNFGPAVDNLLRATPTYINGTLYTVAGYRRTVAAIDPATGETLWTFREPHTTRFERSMRQDYGKGVAYDEVDGRGRIYVVTPAFFLHALDAETGRPIATFGADGTVDLLADLGYAYDAEFGITDSVSIITNSSAPMIVNGVIVVGNSHEQGYYQTRKENVPGHILAYDT